MSPGCCLLELVVQASSQLLAYWYYHLPNFILAAVMYTLLGTAKLNGINPQRYLRHVLERIADHPSNRIDELLPWAVAAKWADDASAKDMPLAA